MKINEYITIGEAAELMGVTKNTLKNWEAAGKIRSFRNKMNGYRLYKEQELIKFRDSVVSVTIPGCQIDMNDLF